MSGLQTRVGNWTMKWKTIPRGNEGMAWVEISQVAKTVSLQVSWRRDPDGIRLLFVQNAKQGGQNPDLEGAQGLHGFDLQSHKDDEGRTAFHVTKRGSHLEWSGVSFAYGEQAPQINQRAGNNKAIRIRAQMPGKILRIMVVPGQIIVKGQPLILMEAMKMENEIQASQPGKVSQVKVAEGQAVETGADLVLFEV